uniref:Uncharacterized protein n=1 Tax=Arundo donax TaxID=35708 RepID=A0A0A9HZ25_ARUDO
MKMKMCLLSSPQVHNFTLRPRQHHELSHTNNPNNAHWVAQADGL